MFIPTRIDRNKPAVASESRLKTRLKAEKKERKNFFPCSQRQLQLHDQLKHGEKRLLVCSKNLKSSGPQTSNSIGKETTFGSLMEHDENQALRKVFDSSEDAFLRLSISGRRYRLLKRTIVRKEAELRRQTSFPTSTTCDELLSSNPETTIKPSQSACDNSAHSSITITSNERQQTPPATAIVTKSIISNVVPPSVATDPESRSTLLFRLIDPRIPLHEKVSHCNGAFYLSTSKEFYFARSSTLFDPIIDYYRSPTGSSIGGPPPTPGTSSSSSSSYIHTPTHICPESFAAELSFWGLLRLKLIGGCCLSGDRFDQLSAVEERNTNRVSPLPRTTVVPDYISYSCSETEAAGDSAVQSPPPPPNCHHRRRRSSLNHQPLMILKNGGAVASTSASCSSPPSKTPTDLLLSSNSNNNNKEGRAVRSLGVDDDLEAARLFGEDEQQHERDGDDDQFTGAFFGKARREAFNFMEDPSSSKPAKIFSLISVAVVMISVLDLIIASLPACQIRKGFNDRDPKPHWILAYAEIGCIVWFTSEYLIRLLITARKWDFLQDPPNQIDVLSVLPFYVETSLDMSGISIENLSNVRGALLTLRILRVLRVARIFKLAKYSGGLQSFAQTLKASYREIGMLMLFLSTTIVLFSTTVYFLEKDVDETPFTSIPATFWWCIVTMTTVGYGDMAPVSVGGKLVASLTSVSGVIVLAFPITIIVENFNKCYREGQSSKSDDPGGEGQAAGENGDGRPLPRVHGFGVI